MKPSKPLSALLMVSSLTLFACSSDPEEASNNAQNNEQNNVQNNGGGGFPCPTIDLSEPKIFTPTAEDGVTFGIKYPEAFEAVEPTEQDRLGKTARFEYAFQNPADKRYPNRIYRITLLEDPPIPGVGGSESWPEYKQGTGYGQDGDTSYSGEYNAGELTIDGQSYKVFRSAGTEQGRFFFYVPGDQGNKKIEVRTHTIKPQPAGQVDTDARCPATYDAVALDVLKSIDLP